MRRFGVSVVLALVFANCAGIKQLAGQASGGAPGSDGGGSTGGSTGGTGGLPGMPVTHPIAGTIMSDVGDTITVSGKPAQAHLTVRLDAGGMPNARWSVDDVSIGSVGGDGVFTANGTVGGVATVTATVGAGTVTTTITVNVDIIENPGALSDPDQGSIRTGGQGGDPQFKWLYPYDGTVFPRGLAAPSLQFAGAGGARATYLKISAPHFSYQQFASAVEPLRVTIPEPLWKGLTLTAKAKDAVKVSVTKLVGATVTGPVTQSWFVAGASIKGIVYYNTYSSPLAGGGGVMRIPAGGKAEVVVSGCTVCHSVSAAGNVLAAGTNNLPDELDEWNPGDSATFDLNVAGAATPRTRSTEGRLFSFMALSPDGRLGLVNGLPPKRWPPFISRGVYSGMGMSSRLVDTATGHDIDAPSLSKFVQYATTPAFSPDGAHVAFSNGDRLGAMCLTPSCVGDCLKTCERVLTVLDFDGKAAPPAFSNPVDVVTQIGDAKAVAWPTFLPDSKAIVFHEGDSFDSYVFTPGGGPSLPQHAELRLVEIQSKTIKALNAINGRGPTGETYLPYGELEEAKLNYEPSVLPVAVGGYYWVLFTSRRTYGNTISPTSTGPSGANVWGTEAQPSPRKKIWIAAIDLEHAGKDDPSHPAFYLPGQEVESGNMRAFAALAPCKPNNLGCETGADCCGGFCRETSRSPEGIPVLACVPPPANTCSNVDELCTTVADCCNPTNQCISGRCSLVIP